jgi:hypothetical protein
LNGNYNLFAAKIAWDIPVDLDMCTMQSLLATKSICSAIMGDNLEAFEACYEVLPALPTWVQPFIHGMQSNAVVVIQVCIILVCVLTPTEPTYSNVMTNSNPSRCRCLPVLNQSPESRYLVLGLAREVA